jgi:hypothetical protein
MVEYMTIGQAAPKTEGADEEPAKQSPLPVADDETDVDNDDNLYTDHNDVNNDNLDADHDDDVSLCFHSINDILGTTGFVPRALVAEELHVVSFDEPTSFTEVERSPN